MLTIVCIIWAFVWGPDALNAWRNRKNRNRELDDLRNMRCVEDIAWRKNDR